jgi:hypothetical protein
MTMDISFLIIGASLALWGLGALMDRNAVKTHRERRHARPSR